MSLSDTMPSTRLLPASTMTTRLTPTEFKDNHVISYKMKLMTVNPPYYHKERNIPGFDKRSITLCSESERKHIWHLWFASSYREYASCPSCNAYISSEMEINLIWKLNVFELIQCNFCLWKKEVRIPLSKPKQVTECRVANQLWHARTKILHETKPT